MIYCLKDTKSPFSGKVDGDAKGTFKNGLLMAYGKSILRNSFI